MRRRRYDETAPFAQRGAGAGKVGLARAMRSEPTRAEAWLWRALRRRQAAGLRWRRQHVIAGFIADFYCPALRLAVEVDGAVHDDRLAQDTERERLLVRLGVRLLRFRNEEVLADADAVVTSILASPPLSPRKSGGRGPGG